MGSKQQYVVEALGRSSSAVADLRWRFQEAGASMSATKSLSEGGGGGYREGEPARVIAIADRMQVERPRLECIDRALAKLEAETLWAAEFLRAVFVPQHYPPEMRAYYGELAGAVVGMATRKCPGVADPVRWLIARIKADSPAASELRQKAEQNLTDALYLYSEAARSQRPKRPRKSPLDRVRRAIERMQRGER